MLWVMMMDVSESRGVVKWLPPPSVSRTKILSPTYVRPPPMMTTSGPLGTSEGEKILTFLFAVGSDIALIPSLTVTARNRKHFEVFTGVSAIVTGFLYNACDALDVSLFLSKDDWHRINNVMAITYCALLAVYLMCNESDDWNTLLRYNAFALVTVAQVKDAFWMERSQWSILVIATYALLPVIKFVGTRRVPNYRRQKDDEFEQPIMTTRSYSLYAQTRKGLMFALFASVFFILGLDEHNDPFRICHSIAHVFMGAALYQLWAIVPPRRKKREDIDDYGGAISWA